MGIYSPDRKAIYLSPNRLELLHRRRGLSDQQNGCMVCAASSLSRCLAVSLSVFSSPADSGYHGLSRAARYSGSQKNKRQPQKRLPPFILTAARTEYGLSMVGANGLESPQLQF
jgi:hypothetical protein